MSPEKTPARKKFNVQVKPLVLRLEEAMETLLQDYSPGDRIPSEDMLSDLMGVSRASIRECLRGLEERGRIIRRHGVGTFLASNKPVFETGLEALESMEAYAQRRGLVSKVKALDVRPGTAASEIAEKLKLETCAPLPLVTRTYIIEDATVAYMYDAIPASLVTADELRPVCTGSLLEYLQSNEKLAPWYAHTNILTVQADSDLAEKMNVEVGTDLLYLDELLFSVDDRLINYSRRFYNTRYIHYHIIRKRLIDLNGGR